MVGAGSVFWKLMRCGGRGGVPRVVHVVAWNTSQSMYGQTVSCVLVACDCGGSLLFWPSGARVSSEHSSQSGGRCAGHSLVLCVVRFDCSQRVPLMMQALPLQSPGPWSSDSAWLKGHLLCYGEGQCLP